MKNPNSGKLRFSAFSAVAVLAAGLSACSSGNVSVTGTGGQAAGTPPTGAPSRTVNGGGSGNAGGNGVGGIKSASNIFYERVLVDDGQVQSVVALSYLPESSSGAEPFGISLRVPQVFGNNPIFRPSSDSITYLRSTGIGSDALVSVSLESGASQSLFAFPRSAADFALSPSGSNLAWAGRDGSLSVVQLGGASSDIQAIKLGGYRAKSVAWNSTGTRLLMRTDADAWVFAKNGASWQQEETFRSVTAAAFSPDGLSLATVGHDDKTLRVAKLGASGAGFSHALDSSEIYDLSWAQGGLLTYWARLSNGSQEIRSFDILGKDSVAEKTLARLSVPAWVQGGVICPVWSQDGESLYYSDYADNEYVIERLSGGRTDVFAQAPAADEGFVCPKGE
jgi:WD40 repeat protein